METRLLFVHALSPLHAGTGQGVGVIDLPIAREKATNIPYVPGSSVKGSLRDSCTNTKECKIVFGPETSNADEHAGSAVFSDQRLLFLPIRSLAGTFAWVTCPYILHRFVRDAKEVTLPQGINVRDTNVPQTANTSECKIALTGCALRIQTKVYLEDLDLNARTDADTSIWATWFKEQLFPNNTQWQTIFEQRLCIVHDDVFAFLLQTATDITARIKLQEDTKTVQTGGLWYEEALPTETILYGLVMHVPIKHTQKNGVDVFDVIRKLTGKTLQFGGKATVGRGLCQVNLR